MLKRLNSTVATVALCAVFSGAASAQNVKVTPLGGITGEFCAQDRALVFVKAVHVPVHVPLSGKTMEFDAVGKCVAGC